MSIEIKWTDPALAQKQALTNAQQKIVGRIINDLQGNAHIGTIYQQTTPVTYAVIWTSMTVTYTKSHPKDPKWLEIQAVFPTNLTSIHEYEESRK